MKKIYLLPLLLLFFNCNKKASDEMMEEKEEIFVTSFKIAEDGEEQSYTFDGPENLVFARLFPNNEVWIRLATDKANDGEDSPHLDIDICNYGGAGTYLPISPRNRPCPDGMLWDVWWHGEEKIYINQATSSPCELTLSIEGDTLTGTFSCADLIEFQGEDGKISLMEGQFRCPLTE